MAMPSLSAVRTGNTIGSGSDPAARITSAAVADVLVLCYHALSPDWSAALSTTPERFESQLAWLARRGYRGATFSDAIAANGGRGGKVVAVTFDDAYRSVGDLSRPVLDRLGWPATVFAPSGWIGRDEPMSWPGVDQWLGGPHERELYPPSWGGLCQLAPARPGVR